MTDKLLWDVKSRRQADDLRIQLVEEVLNRMTKAELRSQLHQYLYLSYQGYTDQQLRSEAFKRGIELEETND